jgi:hypothetical protein
MTIVGIEDMNKMNIQFSTNDVDDAIKRAKNLVKQFEGTGYCKSITLCYQVDNSKAKRLNYTEPNHFYNKIGVIQ